MNLNRLKEILAIQTHSKDETRMVAYLMSYITNLISERNDTFAEIDEQGNIYITKGIANFYPTIVAHIDTVHLIKPDIEILEVEGSLWAFSENKQIGIGGDDKVGIFACLEILDKFPVAKVAFFTQEEIGCVGSKNSNISFFDDSSFIAQCDRRGSSDLIKYGCATQLFSDEFQKEITQYLTKWGFAITTGGQTDVVALKDKGLKVSCFNISCGYVNPHTDQETVVIKDVERCVSFVSELFEFISNKQWIHELNKPKGKSKSSYSVDDYDRYYRDEDSYKHNHKKNKKDKKKENLNIDTIHDKDTRQWSLGPDLMGGCKSLHKIPLLLAPHNPLPNDYGGMPSVIRRLGIDLN